MTKNRTQGPGGPAAEREAAKDVETDAEKTKTSEAAPSEDDRTEVDADVKSEEKTDEADKTDDKTNDKADAEKTEVAETSPEKAPGKAPEKTEDRPEETSEEASVEKPVDAQDEETDAATEKPVDSSAPVEAAEGAASDEKLEKPVEKADEKVEEKTDEKTDEKVEAKTEASRSSFARRLLKGCFFLAVLLAILAVGGFFGLRHYVNEVPVPVTVKTASVDVMVEEGDGARRIIAKMREAGLEVEDWSMRAASRLHPSGMGRIHAGLYRFPAGVTRTGILDLLAEGPVIDQQLRIPDGATIWEVRAIFAEGVNLKPVTRGMSEEELKSALGLSDYPSLEGFFAPDTYRYGSGTTDLAVMKQAVARQKRLLDEAWASRSEDVAVRTPYEALILASIVEKETGERSDRHLVSSVFHNRMKVGMPLQTDPTVIYGLGPAWKGRLTKQDLRSDAPYNTYRIPGLPPTPISMPTPASIEAAVHPAESRYLYFVSRGDGTSEFTTNLKDHNAAVRHFILRKQTTPLKLPKTTEEKGPLRAQ